MNFTRLDANRWQTGEYRIERWRAHDRCGVHLQYAARCREEPLHREPLANLEEAKKRCAQHADLVAVRALQEMLDVADEEEYP